MTFRYILSMSAFSISNEIGEETKGRTECPYDLECLSSRDWQTCAVESKLGETFLVIEKCAKDFCSNVISFGYSYYLCKCPIRCELFRRHHK